MAQTRRDFLTQSSLTAAALLTGARVTRAAVSDSPAPSARAASGAAAIMSEKQTISIGIELYGVRGELAADLPGTLKAVAKMGYEVVEFYSPYFQWKYPYAKDVRAMLDDLGLKCYSTHNGLPSLTAGETMDHAIELNQILGSKIIVLAAPPHVVQGVEAWRKLCDQLTIASQKFAEHGLTAGFHNHANEWAMLEGERRIMDFIAANTPKEFVLQLDVGTCVAAGANPVAWITANPGRIRSVHLKDWAPGAAADQKAYRVLFAEGVAPWKEIFAAAESVGGVEYYLMEQEGSRFSELETAGRCLATYKKMREQI